MVDWDDNQKRKAFREALQQVYPSSAELELFVDEELNENLAVVAGGDNLQVTAHALMKWARAKGRLDQVYQAFKDQNPRHAVIATVERQAIVSPSFNLPQADWDLLFGLFALDDLADVKRAFLRGFKDALGLPFQQAQPQHPSLIELAQIRELLEIYDTKASGPVLAVRFVEAAIAELQRSSEGTNRDFTTLVQWRDRIAAQYQVQLQAPALTQKVTRHAYLLVALEEHGSDVNVYPELRITGLDKPIRFGATPTTCAVDQVAEQLSIWIRQAEEALEDDTCDDPEVTLEIFLPCHHLDIDIATTWSVQDKRGDPVPLGYHRRFVVRSAERIRDRQIQRSLKRRWADLEACVTARNACDRFHLQTDCPPQKGILCALLKDGEAPGLKFVAQLPTDPSRRRDLLNDIIDTAVPIALWPGEIADVDPVVLEQTFNALLTTCDLTNFTDLAKGWRKQRLTSGATQPIKLLCDRPDRLPRLPDLETQADTDAIVA